jgi:VIT1/CCC1 family predicted Fe2+/Mn2+ transporter
MGPVETDCYPMESVLAISSCYQPNAIRYSTIAGFRGLESDAIVVVGVDELTSESVHSLLYVAASRARALLAIFINEEVRLITMLWWISSNVRRRLTDGVVQHEHAVLVVGSCKRLIGSDDRVWRLPLGHRWGTLATVRRLADFAPRLKETRQDMHAAKGENP